MKNLLAFIFSVVACLGVSSCLKRGHFSEIPDLKFYSYSTGDTVDAVLHQTNKYVRIKFSFTDGDGDLGLEQANNAPPYDYNIVATLFKNKNGVYEQSSQEKSRITDLSQYANKDGLQGYIEVTYLPYLPSDTKVRYDIYILDKALHRSNTISTPEITLK